MKKQPKTFCIYLENNQYSLEKLKNVISSGQFYGWKISPFPGVLGDSIDWNKQKIKPAEERKFQRRKGAQGCWLSHFLLWKKCIELNEPIIVLEHDIVFLDSWKELTIDADAIKLFKLTKFKEDSYTGKWQVGAHAYILTPVGAEKLVFWCEQNFAYHADMIIGSNVIHWRNLDYDLVQISEENISTTRYKVF
jgi:glycosyl transferase family 25